MKVSGFPTKDVKSSWWWLESWVGGEPKQYLKDPGGS